MRSANSESNIFEGGWYQNSDYYITGTSNITGGTNYIATLSNVIKGTEAGKLSFVTVKDMSP